MRRSASVVTLLAPGTARFNQRPWPDWLTSTAVALVFVLVGAGTSLAQGADPPGYSDAIKQALEELDANNLPEALAEFRRAHEIFPNARSLRGMGMVEFDLRDYEHAASHLEQALASEVKPLSGKLRSETEGLLERALRYLGEIRVVTDPQDATVLVDGSPAQLRADGTLLLNPGDHVIEVSAAGRARDRRNVQVSGGERRQLMISLSKVDRAAQAAESTAAVPLSPEPAQSERQPVYRKWWVWTLVAVAVAGGATTAAILLTKDKEPGPQPVEGTNTVGVSVHALSSF
jgi:tetratricopeptide (TPR) repeat protein